jgi:hypothetical protein
MQPRSLHRTSSKTFTLFLPPSLLVCYHSCDTSHVFQSRIILQTVRRKHHCIRDKIAFCGSQLGNKHGSHLLHAFRRGWGSSSIKVNLVIHITSKNPCSRHLNNISDIWKSSLRYVYEIQTGSPSSLNILKHVLLPLGTLFARNVRPTAGVVVRPVIAIVVRRATRNLYGQLWSARQ